MKIVLVFCWVAVFSEICNGAALSLFSAYDSNMVVQLSKPWSLYGYGSPSASVSVTFFGQKFPAVVQADQTWSVYLPPTTNHQLTTQIVVESGAESLTLTNVCFGEVFVCSGQSNMGLTVEQSSNWTTEQTQANRPNLRLLQVETNAAYPNVSTPQRDFIASQPWAPSTAATAAQFSGVCYYFGVNLLEQLGGDVPVGLIQSAWGGTPIEVWMSPASLKACGESSLAGSPTPVPPRSALRMFDLPLGTRRAALDASVPGYLSSSLYYSMIYPLLVVPIQAVLWYQGESNSGNPTGYAACFPAMIEQWRADWSQASLTSADFPFVFAQLSAWPTGPASTLVSDTRYAQTAALKLPRVGMAVTVDVADIASPNSCIHPPNKQAVGLRLSLVIQTLLYNNTQVISSGPQLTAVNVDYWDQSWGNYHDGTGEFGLCSWHDTFAIYCGGMRLKFDQPLSLVVPPSGLLNFNNGFEVMLTNGLWQPASVTGLIDPFTLQLNVTGQGGEFAGLRYGWYDYPAMPLQNAQGLPVAPFNVSLMPPSAH
eukprot:TRINITY_DN14667_c0_g1_i1.p1 TRINITY_DN14667_c0_g1~~TRINITY_DN14667_c0_g1_i1.p1  ORF type:complete len:539 (-),score=125.30 TRINITY_DN14667_c0_g1_i1:392-2008(-)